MSDTTGISWTKHTWNPWEGCTRISPGCAHCYMFPLLKRFGRDPTTIRQTKTWRDPLRWDAEAAKAGTPSMVFTCSLSDWFHKDADAWRQEAWEVIRQCPHLRFQVLTKRPLRIPDHLPADWGDGYDNVWLGVSIEDNEHVWRADVLRKIPATVRFISAEPLLGPLPGLDLRGFQWLIVGGESGPRHRHMSLDWARELRDQAHDADVAFFFKQISARQPGRGEVLDGRRWHEFPSMSVEHHATEHFQPEQETGHLEEWASQDIPQQEKQEMETERLQDEVRRQQQEINSLQVELRRKHQTAESLEAELERQRLETKRLEALENRLRLLEAEATNRAIKAEQKAQTLTDDLGHLNNLSFEINLRRQASLLNSPFSDFINLAVLGLIWPCTREDVEKAHKAAAMKDHPDRGGNAEHFKIKQEAYERLRNSLLLSAFT